MYGSNHFVAEQYNQRGLIELDQFRHDEPAALASKTRTQTLWGEVMNRIFASLFVGSMLLIVASNSFGQSLDEVTVTATRRAESIQDVPVSVTSVSADIMEKVGITDVEDLTALVPNFEINSSPVIPNLYIRGLGGGLTHSIEQSVGRFVDDVYIGRSVLNLHPFMDVASVEVLRGPQGTLFGKNTAAGAMIMRTNDPTQDFDAGLNVSYGSYETTGGVTEVNGFVSGGLSERVSGRVAFLYKDRDGFYRNLSTPGGPDGAQREDYGVQGKLRFDVSDATTINLKASYMEYEEDGSDVAEMAVIGGPPLPFWQARWTDSGVTNADEFTAGLDWNVYYNCAEAFSTAEAGNVSIGAWCPMRDMESTNVTFDVEHEIEAGSIKFIAAIQDYEYVHRFHGLDGGFGNFFRAERAEEFDTFSSELRFTSEAGGSFDYIAGIYYEDSEIKRRQDSDLNVGLFGGPFIREHEPWSQQTESFAVFGQARYQFTDRVTGLLGARYSDETKDFAIERFYTPYGSDSPILNQDINLRTESRSEDKFTPAATLQFSVNDDVNIFATVSRGHKTGGFSDRIDSQDAPLQFDAEVIDAIELGMKASWLDNAVTLNLTLFNMDIEGLQLATQTPGSLGDDFVVGNAADSTSQGFEAELNWALSEAFWFGLNYAYTDATYDEFIGSASCAPEFVNSDGDCDLSGQPLQFAPKNKAAAYLDYFADEAIGGWDFGARVDVSYTDDQYTDVSLQDWSLSEAHNMLGASLRLVSPDENITLSLIGRNLGNEKVNAWSAAAGPNTISTMAPPRLLTLKLGMRF